MILAKLAELYDRLAKDSEEGKKLPRQGMSVQKISFEIVLDKEGVLVDVIDAKVAKVFPPLKKGGKEKQVFVPRERSVCGGSHPSGSAATPRFLWDTSAYMLGVFSAKAKKSEKEQLKASRELFPAYRDYHLGILNRFTITDIGFRAVCKFLSAWDPSQISEEIKEKLDHYADNFGVFRILGEKNLVFESEELLSVWDTLSDETSSDKTLVGMALDTGKENVPLARLIEPKIKIGSAVGGAAFASFNDPAYSSYGKNQGANSPLSREGAFKACSALNYLIADSRFHVRMAETTVVFWTGVKTHCEDVLAWILGDVKCDPDTMDEPLLQRIQAFWKVVGNINDPEALQLVQELKTPFYMLGIEPNAARLVVRFWHESTLGDLVDKLRSHHDSMRMEKTFENDPDRLALRQILAETVRKAKDSVPPPLLAGALLRSVIGGLPYPASLYQLVLNRINVSHVDSNGKYRVGRKVSYAQASIVKAFLIRNKSKGGLTMSLNTENKEPAYLLGRLFATLEKTQDDASGGVNAGIGDKFYSSASATPRIVFPTLLDLFRKHLKKMESDKKGLSVNRERLVGEILDDIDSLKGFPANLTLEERGVFALGYYQQMRAFFSKKTDSANETK